MICATLMALLLVFLIPKLGQRDELNFECEHHKDLYHRQVVGFIIEHYVDSVDHARRTVIIRDHNGKDYEVWFSPYNNWNDFERIKVNDVISKSPNSFVFLVNNEFKFELKLECKYN
jgi:hypothetical protein